MSRIEVLQMSKYTRPEIKESSSKDWVMNGEDNEMYKTIIDCYYGSPTNSAIIDSYSRMVYGLGLNVDQKFISKQDLKRVCKDMIMFGESAIEIFKDGTIKFVPKEKVLPNKAVDNKIQKYWYCFDWSDTKKYEPIPKTAYGQGKNTDSQIFIIRDYQVGQFYFSNPSYLSAIDYCMTEIELANYYVNHIQNGLSFGHIINVVGVPQSEEERAKFERQIRNKLSGSSNAGKSLISFNENKDNATTVEALQISDAHQQYQFLSEEAQNKICVAHKVVSGAILGINKSTGFSSNADEIQTAFNETLLNVIQPIQEIIIDALEAITGLKGLEFVQLRTEDVVSDLPNDSGSSNEVLTDDIIKKEASYNGAQIASSLDIMQAVKDGVLTIDQAITFLVQMLQFDPEVAKALFTGKSAEAISMSKEKNKKKITLKKTEVDLVADSLIELGEVIDENEWELIDERKLDGKPTISETELKLAKTFSSFPNAESEQDTDLFKVRYKYAGEGNGQREFCNKVIKADKVYRKEDIELAGSKVVNKGFGLNGADTYDIWLYKGGVNCKHFWQRKIYLRKNNKSISVNEARKMINELEPSERAGAKWEENDKLVAQPAQESNNYFKAK